MTSSRLGRLSPSVRYSSIAAELDSSVKTWVLATTGDQYRVFDYKNVTPSPDIKKSDSAFITSLLFEF